MTDAAGSKIGTAVAAEGARNGRPGSPEVSPVTAGDGTTSGDEVDDDRIAGGSSGTDDSGGGDRNGD